MTDEMQRAECRALSEAELDSVNGATSGFIYAVAEAAEKYLYTHECAIIKGQGASCAN